MKPFTKFILLIILTCIFSSLLWSAEAEPQKNIKQAIVKIYTIFNRYNYYEPWQMEGQGNRSGSGVIISGKRILTNAHIVGDQTFIQVKKAGEAKKYTAEVEIVAHECDLAILKVKDDSFFSGVEPVEIGELAEIRDKVAVYGFPEGGEELSITEGVVSRVEHRNYVHSSAYLLTCQIDAAINPGNSGGPVIKDDKIVGVAFQTMAGQNIGYMVPTPIINHFLTDIKDGSYEGIPDLLISWQKMENPDIHLKYNMTEKQTGVLINNTYPDSPARGILNKDDIILSIDENNIENDGSIEFRKGERTYFGYIAQKKFINDKIKLKILRDKKLIDFEIKLTKQINSGRLVPYEQYDIAPTYFIIGGMVFEPLTLNFLKEWRDWYINAPGNLKYYYFYGEPEDDLKEIIVLVKVLADEINTGYHDLGYNVISYVNRKKISTMEDLLSAFQDNKEKYYIIETEFGYKIILDEDKVKENNSKILKKYKINFDRSEDLSRLQKK